MFHGRKVYSFIDWLITGVPVWSVRCWSR